VGSARIVDRIVRLVSDAVRSVVGSPGQPYKRRAQVGIRLKAYSETPSHNGRTGVHPKPHGIVGTARNRATEWASALARSIGRIDR